MKVKWEMSKANIILIKLDHDDDDDEDDDDDVEDEDDDNEDGQSKWEGRRGMSGDTFSW